MIDSNRTTHIFDEKSWTDVGEINGKLFGRQLSAQLGKISFAGLSLGIDVGQSVFTWFKKLDSGTEGGPELCEATSIYIETLLGIFKEHSLEHEAAWTV
jgi:hypothetical protein